jgi:hypothetical protein
VTPQWRNRIVHASLIWNGQQLLGVDVFQDEEITYRLAQLAPASVSLHPATQ